MTYSLANLIAAVTFLVIAFIAIIRWARIKYLPGTHKERDGMTAVATLAAIIGLGFFVAFLFVTAAES